MPAFFLPLLTNPLLRTAGIAIGAFLCGFFYCWASVPTVDVPAIIRNAEAGRDATWQRKLLEVNESHEHELRTAIEARDSTPDIAADADLGELCDKSPTCRDKAPSGKHRVRSVPPNKVVKGRHKADSVAGPRS